MNNYYAVIYPDNQTINPFGHVVEAENYPDAVIAFNQFVSVYGATVGFINELKVPDEFFKEHNTQ